MSHDTRSPDGAISVEKVVPAPADEIFELLAHPDRHPSFDGSGTVQGPRSSGRRVGLGDSFGMSMHWGVPYSTRNVVVEFEEGRRIAWRTLAPKPLHLVFTGRTWRYELEPVEGGTLVRETWDPSTEAPLSRGFIKARVSGLTKNNMRRTLDRIAEVVGGGLDG